MGRIKRNFYYIILFFGLGVIFFYLLKFLREKGLERKIGAYDRVADSVDDIDEVVGMKLMEAKIYLNKLKEEEKAIAQLSELLDKYPESLFTDAIIFELASAYEKKSEWDRAQNYFELLISRYKDSPYLKEAEERLTYIKQKKGGK